jgi:integrase
MRVVPILYKKFVSAKIDEYTAWLMAAGETEANAHALAQGARRYLVWHTNTLGCEPKALRLGDLLKYCAALQATPETDAADTESVLQSLARLDAFFNATGSKQEPFTLPAEVQPGPHEEAAACSFPLTENEVDGFRQQVLDQYGLRDHAIVTLMAYTGLHMAEVLDLLKEDVDWPGQRIRPARGQDVPPQTIPLHPKAAEALTAWLAASKDAGPRLFPGQARDRRLSHFKLLARLFPPNTQRVTPYRLRYFFDTCVQPAQAPSATAEPPGHRAEPSLQTLVHTLVVRELNAFLSAAPGENRYGEIVPKVNRSQPRTYTAEEIAFILDKRNSGETLTKRFGFTNKNSIFVLRNRLRRKLEERGGRL